MASQFPFAIPNSTPIYCIKMNTLFDNTTCTKHFSEKYVSETINIYKTNQII